MPSVMRTITPEKRRRALIVGILGGIAIALIVSFQVVITLTKPAPLSTPSEQEAQTNSRLINGMESIKESITGLKEVTGEAWEVAQVEAQNQ